ncbi:MAG: DUF1311 domain-containing protein [Rhodobacteraceae bacterium]|nr:DUF1311 domain-containing protein [Paracoccaceae bacterium]
MRPILALLLSAATALADTPPGTCETQANIPEMADCLTYHLGLAERELGNALSDLRSRFPQTSTLLDQSQASWASYRDATCYYAADPSDFARGSESILIELSCKRTETERRAASLRAMFTD